MPFDLTASELAAALVRREFSVVEVAQAFLDRAGHDRLGAFLTIDPEWTMRAARHAQSLIDSGTAGPLTGVPVAIKDNVSTRGVATTCASRLLEGYIPPYDATAVERMAGAGLVPLGKTNLDEFAMGTSCENSAYQPTRNPWDSERSPGGSSGGSAAAVAGRLSPLAIGSDTGGSIRMPASVCGVVGFKPTYGRVSRYGLVAFASSLDQIGPFARTVQDTNALAAVLSGHDPRDSTSLDLPPISVDACTRGSLNGKRFALPKELLASRIEDGTRAAFELALDHLRREGAEVAEVSLPSLKLGVTTYYIIAPAEASSNLARFDGIRFGPRVEGAGHEEMVAKTRGELFGREVKTRIMIGTYVLSAGYYDAYYVRAQQVRTSMRQECDRVFTEFDAILTPTCPRPAFKLGEMRADPMAMKGLDLCTIPANMGGYPALTLNCGFSGGLPVGLQIIGPNLADEQILGIAAAMERALPDANPRAPELEH